MVGRWKQVVWQQGGYTTCASCTQTIPWISVKNTDCDECEQSGMDENHTNALWPHSQPCMACCTPHLSPCSTNRQVQMWQENDSEWCALWVQICETTVVNHCTNKQNHCEWHWHHNHNTHFLKAHCSNHHPEKGRTRSVTWHTVLCTTRHGWDGYSAMTSSPKPFHFLNASHSVHIWQNMPTPSNWSSLQQHTSCDTRSHPCSCWLVGFNSVKSWWNRFYSVMLFVWYRLTYVTYTMIYGIMIMKNEYCFVYCA